MGIDESINICLSLVGVIAFLITFWGMIKTLGDKQDNEPKWHKSAGMKFEEYDSEMKRYSSNNFIYAVFILLLLLTGIFDAMFILFELNLINDKPSELFVNYGKQGFGYILNLCCMLMGIIWLASVSRGGD